MYSVSNDYKSIMQNPQITQFGLMGVIGETEFLEDNILRGSLYISNQCCNGDNFSIGSMYIGELKATFVGVSVRERQDIQLWEGLRVDGEAYEFVPMGIYRVS